jgi:enediyne biosynthesis protein E4
LTIQNRERSNEGIEVLGIGHQPKIDLLEIRWPQPSGRVETFTQVPVDRYIPFVEGAGIG